MLPALYSYPAAVTFETVKVTLPVFFGMPVSETVQVVLPAATVHLGEPPVPVVLQVSIFFVRISFTPLLILSKIYTVTFQTNQNNYLPEEVPIRATTNLK